MTKHLRGPPRGKGSSPSSSSSSSSPSSSTPPSTRAARAARRAAGPRVPERPPRTAADQARLADLFLDTIGVVAAHNRGQFAQEAWQCKNLCRETRYVAGLTQRGTTADLIFHGTRLGGVAKLRDEAQARQREAYKGYGRTTQLIRAIESDDLARVQQLFELGCPASVINAQDDLGRTALLWASFKGREALVRELLQRGADVNVQDTTGWLPLMRASCEAHLAVVRALCGVASISLSARSSSGRTALGYALVCKRTKVAAFLRAQGAQE